MKHLLFVADGMADYPCKELGGRTPLEAAKTPNLDALGAKSILGRVRIPVEQVFSDNCLLSILGYDQQDYPGRGPLEALSMGVKFSGRDLVIRCNLVAEENGLVARYLTDLSDSEAKAFIASLNRIAKPFGAFLVRGNAYKHLLVIKNAKTPVPSLVPPITGESITKATANDSSTAKILNKLVNDSKQVFKNHPANLERIRKGKKPVSMVWFWGAGRLKNSVSLREKYEVETSVVSAVDVIKGLGKWLGASVIKVKGATGYYNTNYEGKAKAAVKALAKKDFVILHVQAPDQAGHEGDAKAKVKAIQDFDERLVGTCLKQLEKKGLLEKCRIGVVPDHYTPIHVMSHAADPVPFLMQRPGVRGDGLAYSEVNAAKGSTGIVDGKTFMKKFFGTALDVKAVFFDMWGTLLVSSKKKEYADVIKAIGVKIDYNTYLSLQVKYWFTNAEMNEEDYFEFFCKKIGVKPTAGTIKKLCSIWRKWRSSMRVFPDVRPVLEELSKKYPLILVSNTEPSSGVSVEDQYGLRKYFDYIYNSCDAGICKPNKLIFLEAARKLGATPSECVMIGDNLKDDVLGSKKAGLKAIWLNRKGKMVTSLQADAVVTDLNQLLEKKIL